MTMDECFSRLANYAQEFGARESGDAFPRVIERWFDGTLVSHSEVAKLSTQLKLPDALFQLPGVQQK